MEPKDHAVKRLDRGERIREEARRALEHGQSPKTPLSLQANFRVEGLTPTAPPAVRPPGTRFLELTRMKTVTSGEGNPLLGKETPSALTAQINAELERLRPANRAQRAGTLLGLLDRLQLADPHRGAALSLRRKALRLLFGEGFFRSEQDLSDERGPHARGGMTGTDDERRD